MSAEPTPVQPEPGRRIVRLILPLAALIALFALFAATDGAGLGITPAAPAETLTFEHTEFTPGQISITVRNTSLQPVIISAVNIDDAIWPFHVTPSPYIPRLAAATVHLDYPWVKGQPYHLTFYTSKSATFNLDIPAGDSASAPAHSPMSFVLIGLYAGLIPAILSLFWLPALRRLDPRWTVLVRAVTAGLLTFLGINLLNDGLRLAVDLGERWQGFGLAGIGLLATFLLLDGVSRRREIAETGDLGEPARRWPLALTIAAGIGLYNLAEGLAVGAAYRQEMLALGFLLVIGLAAQNFGEGPGVVAPLLAEHPPLRDVALLGVIAGGPALLGAWLGGQADSRVMAALLLAVGAGAVFEVVYQLARLIRRESQQRPVPLVVFGGVTAGLVILYLTGLLIR